MHDLVNKLLKIILVLLGLGTLAFLSYVIANPQEEKFTEFYMLGLEGRAEKYPENLKAGEEGSVTIGIVNREQRPMSYRLEAVIDSAVINKVDDIRLADGEKREQAVSFSFPGPGSQQKVEFLLYQPGWSEPYLELHLFVDVAAAP